MPIPAYVFKFGFAALVVAVITGWLWRTAHADAKRDALTAKPDRNNPRFRDTSSRRHSA